MDPAVWRGLTSPRISRRDALRYAGGCGTALGLSAVLSACGVRGTGASAGGGGRSQLPNAGVGTPSWWAGQRLHHQVTFANWPYYIDTVKGGHPSIERFQQLTGIRVGYLEIIDSEPAFYAKIRPSLQARQSPGYDMALMSNIYPEFRYLIDFGWLIPLDHAMMPNFNRYASPLVKNPPWDPGNRYTMAWQSGWTTIGYNSSVVKDPGDSFGVLFDKKYAGRIGMLSDPVELGSAALLALGIDPAASTHQDWEKAAALLRRQRSDGLVRAYYDQSYINDLKNGNLVVSQAYSGDIFQADLNSKYRDLKLLMPREGAMFWTDSMILLMYAQNPKDAMTLMDYYYNPAVQAVVEYYDDYVCPVPSAKHVLESPAGWARSTLHQMMSSVGLPLSVTADAATVFPSPDYVHLSRNYYQFKDQDEVTAWNNLFVPITQGA